MIQEKKVYVEGIPCLQITSGEMPKGVVLFYHGWSSQKEYQAVRGHVLAAYGYDVLIPDAVMANGERLITMRRRHTVRFGRLFFKICAKYPCTSNTWLLGVPACRWL